MDAWCAGKAFIPADGSDRWNWQPGPSLRLELPRSGDWGAWGEAGVAGPWDLPFRGGEQVATEQGGSGGRAGNYRPPPPEICLLRRSRKASWRRQTVSELLLDWWTVGGVGGPVGRGPKDEKEGNGEGSRAVFAFESLPCLHANS